MGDEAHYKYFLEMRGVGANEDPIWNLFSFEQQTSKIYLVFSNNYIKNDQMLPVDEQ